MNLRRGTEDRTLSFNERLFANQRSFKWESLSTPLMSLLGYIKVFVV